MEFDLFKGPGKRAKCPTILQMEAVECGAAALGMVLGHHGRHVPLADLRVACGVGRDGSKANNLVRAARAHGLEAKGYKKEAAALRTYRPPFIVFWNFNHFLVVEGMDDARVFLNDPATGPRRVSWTEFEASYTGVVLFMAPGPEFLPGGRAPSLVASLRQLLESERAALAACLVAGSMLTVPTLAAPVFTQVFVDNVLVQGLSDWLRPLLVGMLVAALLSLVLRHVQGRVQRQLRTKLAVVLGGGFLWRTLRLPVDFYAQRFAGEIGQRAALADKTAMVVATQLTTGAADLLTVVIFAGFMLGYDPVLTGIVLGLAAINGLVLRAISRNNTEDNLRLAMEYGKAAGVSIGGLQAMETLKASGLEDSFFSRWAGYYAKAVNTQQQIGLRQAILGTIPPLLSALVTLIILTVGGLRVMGGHLSIGMLVAYQAMAANFMQPLGRLLGLSSTLQGLHADLLRLEDVLDHAPDPEVERPCLQGPVVAASRLQGRVELRGVTFGYNPLEPPLIEGLDLELAPGQRVALVGGSGSGKSTIAKLVMGLYEPWAGEILFDDRPRREVPREVLSACLTMVDQDLFLFSGSIRQNLTLWDGTIAEPTLVQACKDAEIYQVLAGLNGGLDARLLEGAANLSGGQRQRLEIARALAREPAILVLDEATSALDSESEAVIDRNLRKRGCTCLIVAHRLSTIRDCDEILVFERGRLVQRGTHAQLSRIPGTYGELVAHEAGSGLVAS